MSRRRPLDPPGYSPRAVPPGALIRNQFGLFAAKSESDACVAPDCREVVRCSGYCNKHYLRLRRHGDLTVSNRPITYGSGFWAKVEKTSTCWLWTAGRTTGGYGQCYSPAKGYAHRTAYELLVGAIPYGMTLDHLCRVRHCVNPAHLEPVTSAENTRRAADHRYGRSPVIDLGWRPS